MHATRRLRDEHRLIVRVLDCLEIALRRSADGAPIARADQDAFLEFLRGFADECHHRKEEDELFPRLERRGVDLSGSPVAQVLDEHERGRELSADLARGLAAAEAGDAAARGAAIAAGRALIDLLRRHIDKEEHCLFGLAEEALRGEALEDLLEGYRACEASPVYRKAAERGRELAARLCARFGVAPADEVGPDAGVAYGGWRREPATVPAPDHAHWRGWTAPLPIDAGTQLAARIERALASPAVAVPRRALERLGRRIEPTPILWKTLPSGHLRLFFPVVGEPDHIDSGSVVAIVLLHDLAQERTLYAHPVYAGPEANPLLKHLGGPMSQPRAQEGENGERATRRLLLHKAALWERFEKERATLGVVEASRLWRERYAWSLVRLYFCERCPSCRWGHPAYDGAGSETWRPSGARAPRGGGAPSPAWRPVADSVRASEAFRIEVDYARRGRFRVDETPRLVAPLDAEWSLALFPTDAEHLDGGSIVAVAAWHHRPSGETRYAFCLSFGPEPETLFLRGDRALGLPLPHPAEGAAARADYAAWRARAWSQFWLDELELGVQAASGRWLEGLWGALARLVGAA
jgi:hemerythrin-like domain-containing protein